MKKYIILILAIALNLPVWGQNPQAPTIIPPSPQAMLFQRYHNHEISEATGTPNISIPLFEIEEKGMKIPITLDYDASGVKFKQFDGDVGAG